MLKERNGEISRRLVGASGVAVLGDGVEEAFDAFVLDDHSVIEEGDHEHLLEVTLLHAQHYHQPDQEAHHAPHHAYQQQLELAFVVPRSQGSDLAEEQRDFVEDQFLHPQVEALQVVELLLYVQERRVAVLVDCEVVVDGVAQLSELLEDGPELPAKHHLGVAELTVFLEEGGVWEFATGAVLIYLRVVCVSIVVIVRRHCN